MLLKKINFFDSETTGYQHVAKDGKKLTKKVKK